MSLLPDETIRAALQELRRDFDRMFPIEIEKAPDPGTGFTFVANESVPPNQIAVCLPEGEAEVQVFGERVRIIRWYKVHKTFRFNEDAPPIWSKVPAEIAERDAYRGVMHIGPWRP